MLYLDTLCLLSKLYVDFKQREQMLSSLHYHHIDVERSFVCEVSVLGIKDGIRAAAFVRQISHEPRSITYLGTSSAIALDHSSSVLHQPT